MRILLDTHVLLNAAGKPGNLPPRALELFCDPASELVFSAASIWEIVIKSSLGRGDFRVDAHKLRRGLLSNGYDELAISSEHALAVSGLPPIHRDPFDRILMAQAVIEEITLFTMDRTLAEYPAPVQLI